MIHEDPAAAEPPGATREPGFSSAEPERHWGQLSAGWVDTSSVSRLQKGTPRSTPPLRSTRLPTASTRAPVFRDRLARRQVEAATQGHDAVLALREQPEAAQRPCDFVREQHAPERRRHHRSRLHAGQQRLQRLAEPAAEAAGGSMSRRAHCR
jgi:hypothetical protein